MPVHLPPLSRREFFKRTLLAGAGLAVAPDLFAARWRTDATSWALMADTHIAADVGRIARGINMADHFRRVTRQLFALLKRPAGAFILGDCAFNSGEKDDYATLVTLLAPLRAGGLPVHLALGNHDHRENFWWAFADARSAKRPVKDKHVALLRTSDVNWFMLDSLETTLQTPGSLGTAQLHWLAKSLDANRKKAAIILTHHHPVKAENGNGLKDTERLLELVRPRKQVKAWFFGHTHNWNVRKDESGIHLVNFPPTAYVFHPTIPSGWLHATVRRDGMKLELQCIDPAHEDHGQVVDLDWRTT